MCKDEKDALHISEQTHPKRTEGCSGCILLLEAMKTHSLSTATTFYGLTRALLIKSELGGGRVIRN